MELLTPCKCTSFSWLVRNVGKTMWKGNRQELFLCIFVFLITNLSSWIKFWDNSSCVPVPNDCGNSPALPSYALCLDSVKWWGFLALSPPIGLEKSRGSYSREHLCPSNSTQHLFIWNEHEAVIFQPVWEWIDSRYAEFLLSSSTYLIQRGQLSGLALFWNLLLVTRLPGTMMSHLRFVCLLCASRCILKWRTIISLACPQVHSSPALLITPSVCGIQRVPTSMAQLCTGTSSAM